MVSAWRTIIEGGLKILPHNRRMRVWLWWKKEVEMEEWIEKMDDDKNLWITGQEGDGMVEEASRLREQKDGTGSSGSKKGREGQIEGQRGKKGEGSIEETHVTT